MHFAREINRLMIGILVLFTIIAIAATYWAIVGPDTILERSDNPRLVEAEAGILRGTIFDRNDDELVTSEKSDNQTVTRRYLYPEMYSALGYSSLRYGVSGAEAAFNTILRGDDLQHNFGDQFLGDLMHSPQQGSDIRLTFDRKIQAEIAQDMSNYQGAVVVLSIPQGEVLALVSLPTYDPNTLDANWEQLTQATGKPFFNRTLQGAYQPGGTLETPLLAAALLAGYPVDTVNPDGTQAVHVGDVELKCVQTPPSTAMNLQDAYAYGCPYPFAELMTKLGLRTIEAIFNTFQLSHPPALPGYVVSPPDQPTPTPDVVNLSKSTLLEDALGQGDLTITPLEMASITAAVVNDGNAPMPYTLLATRQPNSPVWITNQDMHPFLPLMTATTARQLQDLMRYAVSTGTARPAAHPNLDIGGQATLAYSGKETQTWFVGFVTWGNRQGAAVAVVIENNTDVGLAAEIGGKALAAAYAHRQQ
jgi:penicillin-binding protein A